MMNLIIISLVTSRDRRTFQNQQMQTLQLNHEFFNAISVDAIKPETISTHYHDWQRPLKVSELACFFSHYAVWQKIVELDAPTLILEDDALLSNDITHLLEQCVSLKNIDYINLENRGRKKFVSKTFKTLNHKYNLFHLYQDRTGAAGYILFPSGAKKLIQKKEQSGVALADAHITNCHNLNGYQIEPAPIVQLDYSDYYGMPIHYLNASKSVLGTEKKPSIPLQFKLKRIISQFILAMRQLTLILSGAERRYISIDTSSFRIEKNEA